MSQLLKTQNAAYIFDPDNDELVLKRNGKFSSVFIGYRLPEKEQVVIKFLNQQLLNNPASVRRMRQEAFPLFHHDKMQQPVDYYEDDENIIVIKQFIAGKTLRELLKTNIKQPVSFYVKCILLVAEMLEDFHRKGFVHCDLRPDNILVAYDESGKINFEYPDIHLLDFGLCRHLNSEEIFTTLPFSLMYSPPEQMLNYHALVKNTADIYSLAVTLYECLTGQPAFVSQNPEMLMHLMLNQPLEKVKNVDEHLIKIIDKATARSKFGLPPAQMEEEDILRKLNEGITARYQHIAEFKIALADYLVKYQLNKKKSFFGRW